MKSVNRWKTRKYHQLRGQLSKNIIFHKFCYLFLFSPSFGATRRLCFVIVLDILPYILVYESNLPFVRRIIHHHEQLNCVLIFCLSVRTALG